MNVTNSCLNAQRSYRYAVQIIGTGCRSCRVHIKRSAAVVLCEMPLSLCEKTSKDFDLLCLSFFPYIFVVQNYAI